LIRLRTWRLRTKVFPFGPPRSSVADGIEARPHAVRRRNCSLDANPHFFF
jgi:hypothetical protein